MKNQLEQLTREQLAEVDRQFSIYSSGAAEIIPEEELKHKIAKSVLIDKPLKIKLGLDPSAPEVAF